MSAAQSAEDYNRERDRRRKPVASKSDPHGRPVLTVRSLVDLALARLDAVLEPIVAPFLAKTLGWGDLVAAGASPVTAIVYDVIEATTPEERAGPFCAALSRLSGAALCSCWEAVKWLEAKGLVRDRKRAPPQSLPAVERLIPSRIAKPGFRPSRLHLRLLRTTKKGLLCSAIRDAERKLAIMEKTGAPKEAIAKVRASLKRRKGLVAQADASHLLRRRLGDLLGQRWIEHAQKTTGCKPRLAASKAFRAAMHEAACALTDEGVPVAKWPEYIEWVHREAGFEVGWWSIKSPRSARAFLAGQTRDWASAEALLKEHGLTRCPSMRHLAEMVEDKLAGREVWADGECARAIDLLCEAWPTLGTRFDSEALRQKDRSSWTFWWHWSGRAERARSDKAHRDEGPPAG